MNLLWAEAPRRVPELTEILAPDTGWSRATVNMMLRRLEEKGAVRVESRERETRRFLDRLYGGSLGLMVASLAGQKALSESDVAALRAILDEAEHKEN